MGRCRLTFEWLLYLEIKELNNRYAINKCAVACFVLERLWITGNMFLVILLEIKCQNLVKSKKHENDNRSKNQFF